MKTFDYILIFLASIILIEGAWRLIVKPLWAIIYDLWKIIRNYKRGIQ